MFKQGGYKTHLFRSRKFLRFSSSVIFVFVPFSSCIMSSSSSEWSMSMLPIEGGPPPPLVFDFLLAGALGCESSALRRELVVPPPEFRLFLPRVLGRAASLSSDITLPPSLMPRAELPPIEMFPFICGDVLIGWTAGAPPACAWSCDGGTTDAYGGGCDCDPFRPCASINKPFAASLSCVS